MKWFTFITALIASQAALANSLGKRATLSDRCDVGYATGTTGGGGGTQTTVSTLKALKSAVSGNAKKTVILEGTISGADAVKVGPNTTLVGKKGATLNGIGIQVNDVENVIVRNIKVSKVVGGDAIQIQRANKVWIDHMDLSSDKDHGKDYYDGLLDVSHGCTGVTLSNNKLYNHFKGSLCGHSDSSTEDDVMTVTYVGNWFQNIGSRAPSFRFGHAHIFNNFYDQVEDGINTRVGAQVLVENNVFVGAKKPLYSTSGGFATAKGNDFGGESNTAPAGNYGSLPYKYSLKGTGNVKSDVTANAGQTLSF